VDADRDRARALQDEYERHGDPTGWFDALYREAKDHPDLIPWARMAPRPELEAWLAAARPDLRGRSCLVVGCGLGDDAELLARAGGRVTAFDIAPAAIDWCRRRFPESPVSYQVADLLEPPATWQGHFDVVLECNTLQTMREEPQGRAVASVAGFVAPGGRLLVVCRGREPDEPMGELPWPLTRSELDAFTQHGLVERSFAEMVTDGVRRFVVEYAK